MIAGQGDDVHDQEDKAGRNAMVASPNQRCAKPSVNNRTQSGEAQRRHEQNRPVKHTDEQQRGPGRKVVVVSLMCALPEAVV
jgi:hypothetical protein